MTLTPFSFALATGSEPDVYKRQAHPEQAPVGEGDEPLEGLKPAPEGVVPGIQKTGDPFDAVTPQKDHRKEDQHRCDGTGDKGYNPSEDLDEYSHGKGEKDYYPPKIGLEQEGPGRKGEDQQGPAHRSSPGKTWLIQFLRQVDGCSEEHHF